MELIERYLAAIAGQLPKSQRDDVVAELREDLLSRMEEREAALGRPLTKAEIEALLKEFGHPLVIAARYWPIQQLIGPETFPFYLYFLKMMALLVVGVQVIVTVIGLATAPEPVQTLARIPGGLFTSLLTGFAWVTAAFVAIEHFGIQRKLLGAWKPLDLPPANIKLRKNKFDLTFEAAAGVVFILWWTGVIHFQNWVGAAHDPSLRIEMTDAWAPFWWPILLYSIAKLTMNLVDVVRPSWVRFSAIGNGLTSLAALVIAIGLLQAGQLIVTTGPWDAETGRTLVEAAEFGLDITFGIVALISVFEMLGALRRLVRLPKADGGVLAA